MQTETKRPAPPSGPGGDYERLPYLSLPFAYTQPSHLAALATLHGLAAPAPERARVLELGCASGGNLLPLAARFPEARCLGLDLSERQISDGKRKIAALGLGNIELRQANILDFVPTAGSFDYVICHGVYSWVPPVVQAAILRVASTALSVTGMAAISYNVLPGWHLRHVLRDIFLHHAGKTGSPQERVARVRELLPKLADGARSSQPAGAAPYGDVLRHEALQLAKMPSSYILGEFLADYNLPCSFQTFSAAAAGHGLSYLCEADLGSTARSLLTPQARKTVAEIAAGDAATTEHYLDMFSGRPFRRSILVSSLRQGARTPALQPATLRTLYISSPLKPNPAASQGDVLAFSDDHGQSISTRSPAIGAALRRLAASFPDNVAVTAVVANAGDETNVLRALLNLLLEGRATLSALPLRVGAASDAKPKVWPLAHAEAVAGLPGVTSLRHVTVAVTKPARQIAVQMDGARDRIELTQWLIAAIERGEITVPAEDTGQSAASVAAKLLDDTLQHLAGCAVLEPAPKST